MKNNLPFFVIMAAIVSFTMACGASKKMTIAVPTQKDAVRGAKKYPGYTLADLTRGEALHTKKCAGCHAPKNPAYFTAEALSKTVPEMAKMTNNNYGGGVGVSATEELDILKYMITMSKG
jgi:mono/diheme cytochrome c family protein